MKEIVESFFKNESIVNHQIDSMNAFVATPDNPDSLMQKWQGQAEDLLN